MRSLFSVILVATLAAGCGAPTQSVSGTAPDAVASSASAGPVVEEVAGAFSIPAVDDRPLTEDQWRERLTSEQFRILREKGTERPYSGEYVDTKT